MMNDESSLYDADPENLDKLFSRILEGQQTPDDATAAETAGSVLERPGQSIGRYKLLEKIGEGGFGVVYTAQQRTPVKRRVALKIIKPGMDSKQVIGRFEAERQALAMMDHPNIARVLDAGATTTGRPYFVMDLIKGIPITEYCDREKLSTQGRLDLFMKVCHAIQHAHQKGIIHRDIKPSNIMITLHDGVPVPKVIDFGIAKATQQELTDKTLYTQYNQFIGTPAYMSPEQAEMSGLDIDTRSDIYSLGVLLYELLTGSTPFDTKELLQSGLDEMRRIIREREPVKPSTRLSQLLSQSGPSSKLATSHSSLATDLDWIVMKCLEKDRTRRYETANGLARDLERHLNNEPVVARPPTAVYMFRRFARRHRAALVVAAAFAALLVLATLVSGVLALRANAARRLADEAHLGERRLNFTMAFDRGLTLCEQGQVGSGLLWLTRALDLAPPDEAAMERVIRANLSAWRRELHTLEGIFPHDAGVVAAAFSPDGKVIVSGSSDGVIHRWDRRTGERLGEPLRHDNEVHEFVFSPDSSRFVTASYDGTARLWETLSGQHIRTFAHDGSHVLGLIWTPEGRIVTSTGKGRVIIWDVDKEEPFDELPSRPTMVHDLALSPDGKRVLGACHDGVVLLWDLATHEIIARFPHAATRVPTADFVGQDGTRIATGDSDGNVFLWEWPSGDSPVEGYRVGEAWRHRGGVHRLRASPDGTRILTASFDNHAQFLNSETGRPLGWPIEHQGAVRGVSISQDGSVLTACDDNAARLWRPAAGSLLREVTYESRSGSEALFTADGRYVLTRGATGSASVHDTETGALFGAPFQPSGGIYAFAVTPDESTIMTGGADGRVQLWEAEMGVPFGRAFDHVGSVWSVAVSRDGGQMLSAGTDGVVKLWDPRSGAPIRTVLTLPHTAFRAVAFHPLDPSLIVVGSTDKLARLIDIRTGETLCRYEGHSGSVRVVDFSPDGKRTITGSYDNTIRIWDVATGRPVSKPMRHRGPFFYFSAFSPDGSTVVTGCDDGTARLWDVATAKPIGPRLVHEAALRTAAFFAGGAQIVTGTATGTARFWAVSITPMQGAVERIKVWLQVVTGMELDSESGEVRVLDAQDWQQRRQSLRRLGGPPRS